VEAGTANGTDRSEAQRAVVGGILKDIEAFNTDDAPARVDLTGKAAFTPGCQIGYMDHAGCHQLNAF
jgi:hypothetical protein